MSKHQEAYALVVSLYDSGDLSHDQAHPILAALEEAEQREEAATRLADAAQAFFNQRGWRAAPDLADALAEYGYGELRGWKKLG